MPTDESSSPVIRNACLTDNLIVNLRHDVWIKEKNDDAVRHFMSALPRPRGLCLGLALPRPTPSLSRPHLASASASAS